MTLGILCPGTVNFLPLLLVMNRTATTFYLMLVIFAGCNTFKVISHQTPGTDFGLFSDYLVENPLQRKDAPKQSYAGYEDLETAIKFHMDNRGYIESKSPDLILRYRVIIDPKVEYRTNNNRYSYNFPGNYNSRERTYNEGILMIEFRNSNTRKVVWQGSLDLRVNKRKRSKEVVLKSVGMIFEQYPYHAGNSEPVLQINN